MWKDTVIIDEGHNAANFLFDMYSLKLWQPEWNYDKDIDPTLENVTKIVADALADLSERYATALSKKMDKLAEELENEVRRYSNVMQCLNNWGKDVLMVKKEEEYKAPKGKKELKGTKQIMINIKPLKVSSFAAEVLWPDDMTSKIILMSATISMNDAEELGLTRMPTGYFESESPIPKERRPFVVLPVANMGWAAQHESIPIVADYLLKLAARHPNEKGIVHCTYSVAKALEKILGRNHRFWFHDNMNKVDVYQRFRAEKGNAVLVASGMAEGIDLPDDAARFQVITKVMYPSLADDVHQWRAHNAPNLYQWDTVRTIIQQSGRICRNPNDFGITYMLDEAFMTLWNRTKNKGMWPKWFTESFVFVKSANG
jgi:Rad3-related DNA helicase